MRILQIRFKNLNSLVGEWHIDLTHPAFASDGIFAITGPTGAGKSTILDAVCLALYGRTPRLNKVTKSGNEIMSRRTGECFAEATFETQTGRYRCHWSQHRAHKKPDGELQAPKHEIADADSGELFKSKIRGVAEQIESATGMDFDRFTRSMLLAQGGFAAFLQAAPDDRAPILEQITGTEIYSRISVRVHERRREEREKLDLLQAETAGIAILEPEREKEIGQSLETRQKEEADLGVALADTGKAIAWLAAIDGLKREIAVLDDEARALQSDIEAFIPDREQLDRAIRAASLEGAYATLAAARKQEADERAALITEEEGLPGLESSAKEQAGMMQSAELHTARVKEDLKAAAPVLQKVRSLDQQLSDLEKTVLEGDTGCKKDATKIDADKTARLGEREKHAAALEALRLVESYLKEHARDEWLVGGLAGIEEQVNGLLLRRKEILQKEKETKKVADALTQAAKSLEERRERLEIRKLELEGASQQLQRRKDTLSTLLGDRLLREYRAEKDTLLREMAFLTKIAELEEHRTKLEDGKPCPLCGATRHPFAEGNVPAPDDTERKIDALTDLIGKAEEHESAIKTLEESETAARTTLADAEKNEFAALHDKKTVETALAEAQTGVEKLRAEFAECRQAFAAKLLPLGIEEISETEISSLPQNLGARLKAWQAEVKKKADIEKRINALDGEIQRLDAVIETQSVALAEKLERLEILKKEFAAGRDARKALYGEKNPDKEENLLYKAVSDAERAEKLARERHGELQRQWNAAQTRVDSLKKSIDRRTPELNRLGSEFSSACVSAGFADEAQFLAAMLPPDRKAALAAAAKVLDERGTELRARLKDRKNKLAAEMDRKVTEASLEELEPRYAQFEASLKALRDVIAGLKHTLNENTAAKARVQEKQAAIEARKKECRRWETLHELIGSSDGKKYRNFAQGLTFDLMVGHANRQLQKLTDRYLLVRDEAQPLELNVVDNYQAGEIRSTKNLSGGESFLVSLALALGLSHMAGRNVRVDSLFLDEGFGTLDEEALDSALETLASLQQDGKLIGVISHVPALKERIGTQIEVTPRTGGRSRISGPGCRRLGAAEQAGEGGS